MGVLMVQIQRDEKEVGFAAHYNDNTCLEYYSLKNVNM